MEQFDAACHEVSKVSDVLVINIFARRRVHCLKTLGTVSCVGIDSVSVVPGADLASGTALTVLGNLLHSVDAGVLVRVAPFELLSVEREQVVVVRGGRSDADCVLGVGVIRLAIGPVYELLAGLVDGPVHAVVDEGVLQFGFRTSSGA